uniref:Uncharacterized protein n=1 Tax=Podarcis muralis TaxID=64176 RepID=A0A670KD20_PODMU
KSKKGRVPKRPEGGASEDLECGICCMPYDRCGRAPRRLGGAHGSWKPSRCRHVICSACVCQLAAGLTGNRRRLVLPPIDAELWQRVVRLEKQGAGGGSKAEERLGEKEGDGEEEDGGEAGQWRLWRALKRLLKGGSGDGDAPARSRRGRGRSRSVPPRRRPPINRECLFSCGRGAWSE